MVRFLAAIRLRKTRKKRLSVREKNHPKTTFGTVKSDLWYGIDPADSVVKTTFGTVKSDLWYGFPGRNKRIKRLLVRGSGVKIRREKRRLVRSKTTFGTEKTTSGTVKWRSDDAQKRRLVRSKTTFGTARSARLLVSIARPIQKRRLVRCRINDVWYWFLILNWIIRSKKYYPERKMTEKTTFGTAYMQKRLLVR